MESLSNKQPSAALKMNQNHDSSFNSPEDSSMKVNSNGREAEFNTVYYGVHIPSDVQQIQDNETTTNVYEDRIEALKVVKKYKKARFKAFSFYHEALDFATYGSEHLNTLASGEVYCDNKPNQQPSVGEKPAPFRGPKSQDLVRLRKMIEAGNLQGVYNTVWENPRYLISSGDTPSILHEGARYNALHVAAKTKNRSMCELILSTISNGNFITLLYGDDCYQDTTERASILLDLYLNTPDKGFNETPLHCAVKYGALDVVELLVSFPQCDKHLKNRFGQTANALICDRCETSSASLKKKIKLLLDETFYVPVLRSEDNCIAPQIGEPFVLSSPPSLNSNMLMPKMEIKAYAGPMDKEDAEKFRRSWKTPPRSLKFDSPVKHSGITNSPKFDCSPVAIKFNDLDKGLERVGRVLANKYNVDWKEYWPFLDSFVNLASEEGLELLENYMRERELSELSSSNSSLDADKRGIEANALSPISDLCKNFEAFSLSDNRSSKRKINFARSDYSKQKQRQANEDVNDLCKKPVVNLLENENFVTTNLNPLLYLERSCQVFATRFTNDILYILENDYDQPTVYLENQLKPLQQLVNSFIEDKRFEALDFRLVHCRLGNLIGLKLKETLLADYEQDYLRKILETWLAMCSKQCDYFSSDDENCNFHQQIKILPKKCTSKNKQIMCLLEYVLNGFLRDESLINITSQGDTTNEEECINIWNKTTACSCIWQTEPNRKSSYSKRSSRRGLISFQGNSVSRQLLFNNGEGACNSPNNCDRINFKLHFDGDQSDDDENTSSEEYYTPPSSPVQYGEEDVDDDDDDIFEDSCLPERTTFIEGNLPTKTDYAVFNAVNCAEDRLDFTKYPNVYKWHHAISLYDEEERKSWSSVHCFSMGKNGRLKQKLF